MALGIKAEYLQDAEKLEKEKAAQAAKNDSKPTKKWAERKNDE
mgnify:CR=1 FL=1